MRRVPEGPPVMGRGTQAPGREGGFTEGCEALVVMLIHWLQGRPASMHAKAPRCMRSCEVLMKPLQQAPSCYHAHLSSP